MILARNDKIIIVVGVVVLLIAAVAVGLYTQEEPKVETKTPKTEGIDVTWSTLTKTYPTTNDFVGKRQIYNETISITGNNIMTVHVKINWTDDNTYFGLLSHGQDTLTAELTYKGITLSETSVGNGTIDFSFTINNRPTTTHFDNETDLMALQTQNALSLDLQVSVKTGEKLRRPLQFIKDKGNDFDLTISYDYFEYQEMYTQNNPDNGDDTTTTDLTSEDVPAYIATLINAGSTRW
jgi:hypothetical protein